MNSMVIRLNLILKKDPCSFTCAEIIVLKLRAAAWWTYTLSDRAFSPLYHLSSRAGAGKKPVQEHLYTNFTCKQ